MLCKNWKMTILRSVTKKVSQCHTIVTGLKASIHAGFEVFVLHVTLLLYLYIRKKVYIYRVYRAKKV